MFLSQNPVRKKALEDIEATVRWAYVYIFLDSVTIEWVEFFLMKFYAVWTVYNWKFYKI